LPTGRYKVNVSSAVNLKVSIYMYKGQNKQIENIKQQKCIQDNKNKLKVGK